MARKGDGGDGRRRELETMRRRDSEGGRCGARREGKAHRGICESSVPLECGEPHVPGRISVPYLQSSVGSFPLC